MSERLIMTVTMQVTEPQALALKAMFNYWDRLASIGSSREVGFFVDGDGNFKPKCELTFSTNLPELTPEMENAAIVRERSGDRVYDFDPIAWLLRKENEKSV